MADELTKAETTEKPILKPYTLDNLHRRKEEDQERIKELIEKPEIKILDQLPIRQEDIDEAKIKLARGLIARERTTEREKEKAGKDPLTGLLNRRAFNERLIYEYERSIREKKPFGILAFDFDHFKQINDTMGHPIGDEVLRELGRTLLETEDKKKILRAIDTPARMGGEEFAIIVPEIADEKTLMFTAERIKQVIEQRLTLIQPLVDQGLKVTTSFGVTLYKPFTKTESRKDAIKRLDKEADVALYQAKNKGRNKVVVYTP